MLKLDWQSLYKACPLDGRTFSRRELFDYFGGPDFTQEYIVDAYRRWEALGRPDVPQELSQEHVQDSYRRRAALGQHEPSRAELEEFTRDERGRMSGAEARWWVLGAGAGLEFWAVKDALVQLKLMQSEALRWLFEEEQLLCYCGAPDEWQPASYALMAQEKHVIAAARTRLDADRQALTPSEEDAAQVYCWYRCRGAKYPDIIAELKNARKPPKTMNALYRMKFRGKEIADKRFGGHCPQPNCPWVQDLIKKKVISPVLEHR